VKGQIGPFNASSSYLMEPTADGTRLINHVELKPSSALLRPLGPLTVRVVKSAVARNRVEPYFVKASALRVAAPASPTSVSVPQRFSWY
jgi:hypothetical protein